MMRPWLKPCMYMWECGMCLDLTFSNCLQVSRDLLSVTVFSPYLWQVGPILLGCGIPHLSWSSLIYWRDLTFHELYSPLSTHTHTYSHTRVFAQPNLLVRCHLSLMALFLFAFSAYVQHRARGLVTARRVRGMPTTSIPTGTGARWTIPGVPPLKPIYGHLTCGICRLQVVIHPSYT